MDTPYTVEAESWMVGHCCEVCDDEIERGQRVTVLDIDHSDAAGRAVAKVAHELCAGVGL
jgi:hypothetical protein